MESLFCVKFIYFYDKWYNKEYYNFYLKEVTMDPSFSHIQMVAIDCDETLLRSDNTVSEYTKDVLHRLQEKGIRITLATGRMYQTAKPVGMSLI